MKKENSKKTVVLKDKLNEKIKGLGFQLSNNSIFKNIREQAEVLNKSSTFKSINKINETLKPVLKIAEKYKINTPKTEQEEKRYIFTPPISYQAEQLEELKEIKKNLNSDNNALYLDYNNGDIFSFGKKIGKINKEIKPGKMFVFLYENKGKLKTHKEICNYVNGEGYKVEKTPQSSTSDWKRELPKNIKNLIENDKKGHYYIP